MANKGQQHVPIAFGNGMRAMTTFQVADVSRPFMSVGRLCEMGNRVLFGNAGGLIMNLQSGHAIPFVKGDGVYVFEVWIPPLSETPLGGQR